MALGMAERTLFLLFFCLRVALASRTFLSADAWLLACPAASLSLGVHSQHSTPIRSFSFSSGPHTVGWRLGFSRSSCLAQSELLPDDTTHSCLSATRPTLKVRVRAATSVLRGWDGIGACCGVGSCPWEDPSILVLACRDLQVWVFGFSPFPRDDSAGRCYPSAMAPSSQPPNSSCVVHAMPSRCIITRCKTKRRTLLRV